MTAPRLKDVFRQKLSRDIAYTVGSFVVLAVSGIAINIAVTALRDAAALGVFNIAYAVYIVASQLAVFGLHYSVIRYAAYHDDSLTERTRLLWTAAICSLALGCVFALLLYSLQSVLQQAFSSRSTATAIGYAAFGLILFPLNKVLLGYMNGLRLMKAFSILQALRYISVTLLVAALAASSLPMETFTLCFLPAEALTAALAWLYLSRRRLVGRCCFATDWVKTHFSFGARGLMAGMFAEVNARVDVLMIGFYLTERQAGIYSFAAMLVDGLYHVIAMVRINFNPVLVAALRDGATQDAVRLRTMSARYLLPATALLAMTIVAAHYVFTIYLLPGKDLDEGLPSLLILMCGLVVVSALVPFDNLMMVSGHPGYQTIQQVAMVAANIAAAALLLPLIGIEGAAVGTTIAYLSSAGILLCLARRIVGWNLLSNSFR